MALKRKWIFPIFLIIIFLIFGVAFALTRPSSEGTANPSSTSPNPSSKPEEKGGGVGTGTLHVYIDSGRTTEAPINSDEIYLVLYGRLYYFRISNITEYKVGQKIHVWAHYLGENHLIGDFTVGSDGAINFEWTIPTLQRERTEIKYKYGLNLTGPNPSWRFAKRATHGVRLTMAIPQAPLGALGATSAFIAAYCIKALNGKRRHPSK